jgi:hypothetical protein
MISILKINKAAFAIFLAVVLLLFTSCHKPGTGGHSSVSGNVKHHSKLIPNAIVYIKYGATEFPGTDVSKYDASITSDTNAHYEFKDLRKGDYYLYGVGWDNSVMQQVAGGIGIKLKYNNANVNDVPVTE